MGYQGFKNPKEGIMNRKTWAVVLAIVLMCGWVSFAAAGDIGYTLREADRGFAEPPARTPNSAVMFLDAALARPLGLATTIVGTGLFVVTLPFTAPSGSAEEAGRGLIGMPGGWTFVRSLGRSDPRFEDRGVFQR